MDKNRSHKKGVTMLANQKISKLFSSKGFTLVEIIVAGLIISITAVGTFGAYLYARQFSDKFRHRTHASSGAQEIAEYIRYRLADGYKNDVYLNTATADYDMDTIAVGNAGYDVDLDDMLNPANWQMNDLVESLAISYTVTDVNFDVDGVEQAGAGADPKRQFKKIVVRINYNNRTTT